MKHSPVHARSSRGVIEDHEKRDECLEEILTLWSAEIGDHPAEAVEHRSASDLNRLQGVWTAISGPRQAELLISGQHLTVHFSNGDVYMGSFTLGAAGRLTTLEVRIDEGPARHKGLSVLCVCELDGETMHWCNATPGEAHQPTAFDDHNPHLLCLRFRREHRAKAR